MLMPCTSDTQLAHAHEDAYDVIHGNKDIIRVSSSGGGMVVVYRGGSFPPKHLPLIKLSAPI